MGGGVSRSCSDMHNFVPSQADAPRTLSLQGLSKEPALFLLFLRNSCSVLGRPPPWGRAGSPSVLTTASNLPGLGSGDTWDTVRPCW